MMSEEMLCYELQVNISLLKRSYSSLSKKLNSKYNFCSFDIITVTFLKCHRKCKCYEVPVVLIFDK